MSNDQQKPAPESGQTEPSYFDPARRAAEQGMAGPAVNPVGAEDPNLSASGVAQPTPAFPPGQMAAPPQPIPQTNSRGGVSSREIWNLTWPQILMMLFQFMVGFTNVWVAGRIDALVQASFGLVIQVFFLFLVIGIAIANASTATMSQALGAGRPLRATRYLGLACNLGLAFCVVTVFLGFIFRHEIMWLIQVPENIVDLSVRMWLFFLFGVPAQYAISLGASAFRAYKKVTMPLYTGMVICVLNFFLNIGLGLGRWGFPDVNLAGLGFPDINLGYQSAHNLGPDGLAIGALISMYAGAVFIFIMLLRHGYLKRAAFAPLRWQKKAVGYLVKVALPAGGNQLSWQLGYLVLLGIVGALPMGSVHALAGMTAGMRIESLLFLPAIAFGMTGTILVGYCLGNGNPVEARRVGLKILIIGCLSMTLVALLIWPFVREVSAFMAPSLDVQPEVVSYLLFNLLATPFTVGSTILGGLLTGAGASIYPFIIYGAVTWLLRLPLAWLLGHVVLNSASGIYASQAISQVVMCCIILLVFFRCDWARFSMYSAKPHQPPKAAG